MKYAELTVEEIQGFVKGYSDFNWPNETKFTVNHSINKVIPALLKALKQKNELLKGCKTILKKEFSKSLNPLSSRPIARHFDSMIKAIEKEIEEK